MKIITAAQRGKKRISDESLFDGMKDNELEGLSDKVPRLEKGKAPWVRWEAENSSFGRTLRLWTGYPDWLPLFVCSDHGVNVHGRVGLNELENKYSIHLTWNEKKYEFLKEHKCIEPIYIQHPWVSYRKQKYTNNVSLNRKGTIVYFPHSNPQSKLVFDVSAFVERLKSLPSEFHPVVLCLMSHDIKKGIHIELKKYGLPIVTAGNTSSQYFVDRFYNIAYRFKYAASVDIGSHVFYLLEAGIPLFLTGDKIDRVVIKDWGEFKKGDRLGEDGLSDEELNRINELKEKLSSVSDEVLPQQRKIADYYLGVHSETTSEDLNKILWKAFRRNKREAAKLYMNIGWKRVKHMIKSIQGVQSDNPEQY